MNLKMKYKVKGLEAKKLKTKKDNPYKKEVIHR
jgi:hypothetical protein